eukprot:scaffold29060_cov69-Phaeocystis_antarctica.AAC.2
MRAHESSAVCKAREEPAPCPTAAHNARPRRSCAHCEAQWASVAHADKQSVHDPGRRRSLFGKKVDAQPARCFSF